MKFALMHDFRNPGPWFRSYPELYHLLLTQCVRAVDFIRDCTGSPSAAISISRCTAWKPLGLFGPRARQMRSTAPSTLAPACPAARPSHP